MPTPHGTRRSPCCPRLTLLGPTPNSWATRCCARPSAPSVAAKLVASILRARDDAAGRGGDDTASEPNLTGIRPHVMADDPDSTNHDLTFTPEPPPATGVGAEESEPAVAAPVLTQGAAEVRPEESPPADKPDELAPSRSDVLARDTEKTPAVTSEAETAPTPNTETTPTAGGGLVNVGWVDPAIAHAIRWALRLRPARETNMPAPVEKAGAQALQANKQDLMSYGIDPSAGRYAALDQASRNAAFSAVLPAEKTSAPDAAPTPEPAQSSLEVPAPVSPPPQKPTPIVPPVEASLAASPAQETPARQELVPEWPSAEQLGIVKAPKQKAILRKWPGLCRRYPGMYNADKVVADEVSRRRLANRVGEVDPNTVGDFLRALRTWLMRSR